MQATLHALGGILLNALPTFFLVILLQLYLRFMFFKPLERTLGARFDATEGARKAAEASLAEAEKRVAEYQAALKAARTEIYAELEKSNRALEDEHSHALMQAKMQAEERVAQAKAELADDAAAARETLIHESDAIADEIATRILRGRAA